MKRVSKFVPAKDFRNWAGLPWDVFSEIFSRVGTVCLLCSVQSMCQQWWKLAHEPQICRRVHLDADQYSFEGYISFAHMVPMCNLENIAFASVDHSSGCLEEFSIQHVCSTNVILHHVSRRSPQLKVLNIGDEADNFREYDLLEACERFPLLEVLHIYSYKNLTEVAIESIGHSCPNLKDFAFTGVGDACEMKSNKITFAIAKSMHGLQKLEIIGDLLDDDGLIAVLDGCVHIGILYIKKCFNLRIKEKLKCRLRKIEMKYHRYSSDECVDLDDDYEKEIALKLIMMMTTVTTMMMMMILTLLEIDDIYVLDYVFHHGFSVI